MQYHQSRWKLPISTISVISPERSGILLFENYNEEIINQVSLEEMRVLVLTVTEEMNEHSADWEKDSI